MQATTWILESPRRTGRHLAGICRRVSSSGRPSQRPSDTGLCARRARQRWCRAHETGEELGWVSRKVFFKPALEWITRGVAAGPGAFFERAMVFVRTTTASDVFAEALVGHLHAMTVLRELRGDATKATNSYDVATGGRRQLLWANGGECMNMDIDGTFMLTTCGWIDKHGVWARGLVQYAEDRSDDGSVDRTRLIVGAFEEKFFADASIDGTHDDVNGTNIVVPLELRLDGVTEYDGAMQTWLYSGDILHGFDDTVMTLSLDEYVTASIGLTKNTEDKTESTDSTEDDFFFFEMGMAVNVTVMDGDGTRVLKMSPSVTFSVEGQKTVKSFALASTRPSKFTASSAMTCGWTSTEPCSYRPRHNNRETWSYDDVSAACGHPSREGGADIKNKDDSDSAWLYVAADLRPEADASDDRSSSAYRYNRAELKGPMNMTVNTCGTTGP